MVKVHTKKKNVAKENMTNMKINTRFRQVMSSTTTLMKAKYLESKQKTSNPREKGEQILSYKLMEVERESGR